MSPQSGDHDERPTGLATLIERRHALKLLAGAGVLALAACSSNDGSSSSTSSPGSSTGGSTTTLGSSTSDASCSTSIPEETGGPFPGDGSNGPNVLTQDGVVRSDITSSFGSSSGVADGVPLALDLTVVDTDGCTPLAGAAVYVWHCDREGRYSMYSDGAEDQNYLRGVQEADADGTVRFASIFPAAYMGRWPHVHFEVYPSLDEATSAGSPIVTTQLALPRDVCEVVYATDGYEASVRNLARTSLDSDMVFSDGHDQQVAAVTGSVGQGYVASLSVPVSASV